MCQRRTHDGGVWIYIMDIRALKAGAPLRGPENLKNLI